MGIFDRMSQGPGNLQQEDYQNWNQMVGSAPPDRFGQAAYQSIQQMDPQEYYQHTQPGVGGTDPFGMLPQQQRGGLAQSLISSLMNRGVDPQQISQVAGFGGMGGFNPSQMSPAQMAALAQWAQQNHPQALGQVAQQYQNQPDVLHSLLGNKALMALAAGLGAKYLADRSRGGGF